MKTTPFYRWLQILLLCEGTIMDALLILGVAAIGAGCDRKDPCAKDGRSRSLQQALEQLRGELEGQRTLVAQFGSEVERFREAHNLVDPDPENSSDIVSTGTRSLEALQRQRRRVNEIEKRIESLTNIRAIRLDAKFATNGNPGTQSPVKDFESWLEASQKTPVDTFAVLQETLASIAAFERRLMERCEQKDEEALRELTVSYMREWIEYQSKKARYVNQKKILEAGQKMYDDGMLASDEN